MTGLRQVPEPGHVRLQYAGDTLRMRLVLPTPAVGAAWVRTNLGGAGVHRREIIAAAEQRDAALLGRDWHDVPMRPVEDGRAFEIELPLAEVGVFAAKAFFLPEDSERPVWPEGPNLRIKVEPAETVAGCTLYTAFTRQFGRNASAGAMDGADADCVARLDAAGYHVIPRSGTFRDLVREVGAIVEDLGFRYLQLLPVFPTPTTFARMGRFGSPFAALDFTDVDPALAVFDRATTPLDQFRELADAVHARGGRLLIDIPINHTGWASWLQVHHPEWFARNADRTFQSPGAWGVTWEDLSKLDYAHRGLWRYIADVFVFWCEQGVDGFRCDAGYMIPCEVWTYVVARVREGFPDTIFLLEGLGGELSAVERLLLEADMNWAYSELFQVHDRAAMEAYLGYSGRLSRTQGVLMHFAETHDNNRLAATSQTHAALRTALAALASHGGAFGITAGVEWFADAKIDVHGAAPLRWGGEPNQVAAIRRLNRLLATHPAFAADAEVRPIPQEGGVLVLQRRSPTGEAVLACMNLDTARAGTAAWEVAHAPFADGPLEDLLGGGPVEVATAGGRRSVTLAAGAVLCLAPPAAPGAGMAPPGGPACRATRQRRRAKLLELWAAEAGPADANALPLDALADRLGEDAAEAVRAVQTRIHGPESAPRLTTWEEPADTRRNVPLPLHHALLVRLRGMAEVDLLQDGCVVRRERTLAQPDGTHVALFGAGVSRTPGDAKLRIRRHGPDGTLSFEAPLLLVNDPADMEVPLRFAGGEVVARDICVLATNGRGAMALVRGAWGTLASQYDAILAANLDPRVPVDRTVLLTRCRVWVVLRGYSQALGAENLLAVEQDAGGCGTWTFRVPCGMGRQVHLRLTLGLVEERNAAHLTVTRLANEEDPDALPAHDAVEVIVRPDLEDRSFHEKTKAFRGPESAWPPSVRVTHANGFVFAPPGGHRLQMTAEPGYFSPAREWRYMVPHPVDATRGLDGATDLFSPGFFALRLRGGASAELVAVAWREGDPLEPVTVPAPRRAESGRAPLRSVLERALQAFVVRRDDSRTIVAGYPWFLDWGRDTLICLRGVIAAGRHEEAADILRQFARFEDRGTLPNMIRGQDHSNRDTSDAPLWFFVACRDLVRAGHAEALETDCGGRSLLEVLRSLARNIEAGTPNGIRCDPRELLVYSPAHFTWMDTNHPAGTPREGYPIEIQALWHAALDFLGEVEGGSGWREKALVVREAIGRRFALPDRAGLADCLHAPAGVAARDARADDAVRPNQLLALTLGAVTDADIAAGVLSACERLLVPGAIRSLADQPVTHPLPVHGRDGQRLNDPQRPYWGRYEGDEDTRRKPAYHNGTAWTWMFPLYSEAWWLRYGPGGRRTARALLASSARLLETGCIGQIPEIVDGDAPHAERGCTAQAWGVTELYRVLRLLD